MVMHWRKNRGPPCVKRALVNRLGGAVTGVTTIVVLVAKFAEGAWITLFFIPSLIVFFNAVRGHYHFVRMATICTAPVVPAVADAPPIAVVPVARWSRISKQALEASSRLSPEIIAVHVEPAEHSELLRETWKRYGP